MRVTRIAMAATVGVVAVAAAGATWLMRGRAGAVATERESAWTPLPRRVQVEVLNVGKSPGAARVGTVLLRHAGLDVVRTGNDTMVFENNRIAVRRGDTTGVGRIIEAIGRADVVDAPDSTPLVDLTVYLGRSFAPPPDRINASH
jgi:hypothetical protein